MAGCSDQAKNMKSRECTDIGNQKKMTFCWIAGVLTGFPISLRHCVGPKGLLHREPRNSDFHKFENPKLSLCDTQN